MWRSGASGFVSIQGGINSHAMIVARGVGLPGIAGVQDFFELAEDGASLILDAEKGLWILNPGSVDFDHYERFQHILDEEQALLQRYAHQPSASKDGYLMPLMANMNIISMFQPTMVRSAVGPGAVQQAERSLRTSTQPFQVSLMKSMANRVSPANTASQLPLIRAFLISMV